jgi:hypothetical protein
MDPSFQSLNGTQFGASCHRIRFNFRRIGTHRLLGENPNLRDFAAYAHWKIRGAVTTAGHGPEALFHDTILKRVKGQNTKPPLWIQQISRMSQKLLNAFQLMVHRDPYSLERAGCSMDASWSVFGGDSLFDNFCQLKAGPYPITAPGSDNRPGNPFRPSLLSETKYEIGQVSFGKPVDNIFSRMVFLRIHPHIQRFITQEAKTPPASLQLIERKTQIQQNAIDTLFSSLGENLWQPGEIIVEQLNFGLEPSESIMSPGNGIGISVDTDERTARPDVL